MWHIIDLQYTMFFYQHNFSTITDEIYPEKAFFFFYGGEEGTPAASSLSGFRSVRLHHITPQTTIRHAAVQTRRDTSRLPPLCIVRAVQHVTELPSSACLCFSVLPPA